MKILVSALAVVAALGFAAAPAMAQQTTTSDGQVVDGLGSGDNVQNRFISDGPANADVTSLTTDIGKYHSGKRINRLDCAIVGVVDCTRLPAKHAVVNAYAQ